MRFLYISLTAFLAFALLLSSCTKTETIIKTETKTDTLIQVHTDTLIHTDTIEVPAKDTILAMDVAGWEYFANPVTLPSGPSTYFTTTEGIKFIPSVPHGGIRLQCKSEIAFKNKSVYFKWKVNGGGQFTDFVPSIKYVPTAGDNSPAIQGVDLESYSVQQSLNGSLLVQPDTWYYTRVAAQTGTNNYQVISATGNYDNKGGTVFASKTIAIYTKHGFPAVRIGDPAAGSASSAVLGECKIADN